MPMFSQLVITNNASSRFEQYGVEYRFNGSNNKSISCSFERFANLFRTEKLFERTFLFSSCEINLWVTSKEYMGSENKPTLISFPPKTLHISMPFITYSSE